MISCIAALICWGRGAQLVNWQQDIFPEIAEVLGVGGQVGSAAFALLRLPRNWSLRVAAVNVVLGDRMADRLQALGIPESKLRVLPNWSDGNAIVPIDASRNALRRAWGLEASFVVGYSGNLGRAHEIETMLMAMKALNRDAKNSSADCAAIKFLIIGGGALRSRLEDQAKRDALDNVDFKPYQPRTQLAETLCTPDVHLVTLRPELEGLVFPSKLYAIAAAGRPMIFIGHQSGEIARIINKLGCGFVVAPGRGTELEQRIRQLARSPTLCRIMGDRARAAFELGWDHTVAVSRWETLFKSLCKCDQTVTTSSSAPFDNKPSK